MQPVPEPGTLLLVGGAIGRSRPVDHCVADADGVRTAGRALVLRQQQTTAQVSCTPRTPRG